MKTAVTTYRGEAPRIEPHLLPDNAAQEAVNCRLQSGALESWRHFLLEKTLANAGPVRTIYLLKDRWLSWDADVDVARGVIEGDTTYRTYLTSPALYGKPQWTNYAMATTGAEPYPVDTRPLGVPPPDTAPTLVPGVDDTPTTFSIDTTDDNASLASSWSINPPLDAGSRVALVLQQTGFYEVVYDENRDPGQEAFAYRNFGVRGVSVLKAEVNFEISGDLGYRQACMIVGATLSGAGIAVVYDNGLLSIRKPTVWGVNFGTAVLATETVTPALSGAVLYTLRTEVVAKEDGTKTVTATVLNGVTVLATVTATNNFEDGDYCGFANGAVADGIFRTEYSSYHVQASGSTGFVPENVATNYVYTHVNDVGEESPPSPLSLTILRPDGVAVAVTTPTTTPVGTDPDYAITHKRIYRSVTGIGGTVFRLVTEITLATATFNDDLDDSELPEDILESQEYDVPPDDLQGIMALPNGIMCGFSKNLLCFSIAGRPHAWPVRARKPIDTDIVALGAIDTTVVVGSQSFVYTCAGNDTFSYSMSKPGAPQSCTSKRSMLFVPGVGVCFASPDGYQVCTGLAGQVSNATEGLFTKRQWQALDPTTIIAAAHDGVLFFWNTGETPDAGRAIDIRPNGFGLIRLSFHAVAVHVDPLEDQLYLVLSRIDEPTDPSLPIQPTFAVAAGSKTIYAFDADPTKDLTYRWKGKLHLPPYPLALRVARVRARSYANILHRVYGEGVQLLESVISGAGTFPLPHQKAQESYEFELMGTSTVRNQQAVEDMSEIS